MEGGKRLVDWMSCFDDAQGQEYNPREPEEVCSSHLRVAPHSMTLLGYYDRVHE